MILETEIDGLLYSLNTDEQEAMVKECVNKKRTGEVVIPESFFHQGIVYRVTGIGEKAFLLCYKLTSIIIPESVTSIGGDTFRDCYSLTSIVIPESVTSIGERAFYSCYSLTSINIPEGVTSIGMWAFGRCYSLTSITIPEGVKSIGNYAFVSCSSLTDIVVAEGNKIYDSRGGCNAIIKTASNTLIVGCSTTIIPDGLTCIGDGAFSDCYKLTAITIPEGVTSIGNWAFSGCSSLTAVNLPLSITCIGSEAFRDCYSLTSITIPKSVTCIGSEAFRDCTGELIVNCHIPSAPEYGFSAFYGSEFTKVTIGEGVAHIGDYAFTGCSKLAAIAIPESVTSIGFEAFLGCRSLTTINIPESVTSIGESAFWGCSSLEFITIPEGVTSIGGAAFSGCTGELTLNCNIPFVSENGFTIFLGSKFTKITIGKSVTSLGEWAFSDCHSLTSILIPKSVASIEKGALKNTGIIYLTILGKPTIYEKAFDGCGKLTDIYCYSEEVPPTDDDAFGGLDLSRITLHVPERALKRYKNTEPWSRFDAIEVIK